MRLFIAISEHTWWALVGDGTMWWWGTCPARHTLVGWRQRARPANSAASGVCGSESEPRSACGFDDASGDSNQAHPQRGELGGCKRLGPGNGIADPEQQPVGSGIQHKRH
jgi:hypothetical protein